MENTLNDLVKYAQEEKWEKVDEIVPRIRNDQSYQNWAIKSGVHNSSGNVRDLAVSILQDAEIVPSKFKEMENTLYSLLRDSNPYVGFRSAFALLNHNPQKYEKDNLVRETVKRARNDDAVAEIANNYRLD